MTVTPIYFKSTKGKGRKALTDIQVCFNLKEEYTKKDNVYSKILNIMSSYYNNIPHTNLRPLTDIVNEIYDSPVASELLITKHEYYNKAYKNDLTHVANTVLLIMTEQVGIQIRNINANRETPAKS